MLPDLQRCVASGLSSKGSRFQKLVYLTRVYSSAGMSNQSAAGYQDFACVVSPRTGPFTNTAPTVVHAHLISLAGINDNAQITRDPNKLNVVISLYSWSYTCLPATSASLQALLRTLGNSVQPLRPPDRLLGLSSTTTPTADDWVKDRILGGYNIIKYRAESGAVSLAVHRGILSPMIPAAIDFPPSDFGTDLAVMDQATGILDLSFQLAWQLGRLMMSSDKSTSAAVMRLRRDCHSDAAGQAKTTAIQSAQKGSNASIVYVAQSDAVNQLLSSIQTTTFMRPSNGVFTNSRWAKMPVSDSSRTTFAFQASTVQTNYSKQLANSQAMYSRGASSQAEAVASPIGITPSLGVAYNELNCPMSTDYATLLAWCMDHWYLQGIPSHYLFPDPDSIPKESIRTFYIDQDWFRVFVDGALSVSEHFTSNDEVRESIKLNLDDYLKLTLVDNQPPLIPKWGFLLRSELVYKFPDMRISAPRTAESNEDTEHDGLPEILRMEAIDQDLLIVLFDREPTLDKFPMGITIHGPEHQLSHGLGEAGDLTDAQLTFRYKPITTILSDMRITLSDIIPSTVILASDQSNTVFDFTNRLLQPSALASIAAKAHTIDEIPVRLSRTGWTATADSAQDGFPAQNVLDGDPSTIWHTRYSPTLDSLPHKIEIDMKRVQGVQGLEYIPRPGATPNGNIGTYIIDVSQDGVTWSSVPVATGTWANTKTTKRVQFARVMCRYVRLKSTAEAESKGYQWASCAEIYILGDPGASLLASQLVSIVPKLQITCSATAQGSLPSYGRLTSSKKRPSVNAPPGATRALRKNAVVSTANIKLTTPAQNFTKLKVIARTDLRVNDPDGVDRNLWVVYFAGQNNGWNYNPGTDQNKTLGHIPPHLAVNIYNVRTVSPGFVPYRSLCALMPFELGFCSDVQISLVSQQLTKGFGLQQVIVTLPVGTAAQTTVLRPFTGNVLPNVRMVAPGRRWFVSSTLFVSNAFKITIQANNDSWDIASVKDMSIKIEDVQLSWSGSQDSDYMRPNISVEERYSQVPSGFSPGSAIGSTTLEIRKVDVRTS